MRKTIAVVSALILAGLVGLLASPAFAQDNQTDTTSDQTTSDDTTSDDTTSDDTTSDDTTSDDTTSDTTSDDTTSDGAEVSIPMTEAYVVGAAGDTVQLGSSDVDASLQGRTCEVVATITNQSSVHPGNTLIVTSGGSSVSIPNIEDVADATVTSGGTLTLGASISAAVVLGADGATSLGSSLTVACAALPVTPIAPVVPAAPSYTG